MTVKTYSLKKDGNKKLSNNFKVREFACKDGSDKVLIDTDLVNLLQKIRDYFNKPVKINSGYRTETHNKKVGGATNSYHLKGQASDIHIEGINPVLVALYAERLNAGGIGVYPNFIHVDTRKNKTRWVE
jgi:uncharacterized protein YcbK (DUF882 family)